MSNWFSPSSYDLIFFSPNPLCCIKTEPFFTNAPNTLARTHFNAFLCTVTIFTCMHGMVFNWFVHAMFSHLKLFWQAFEAKKHKRRQRQQQRLPKCVDDKSYYWNTHCWSFATLNALIERSIHTFWFYYFLSTPFPRTVAINMNYLAQTHTRTTLKHFQNVRNKPFSKSPFHLCRAQHMYVHIECRLFVFIDMVIREKWLFHSDWKQQQSRNHNAFEDEKSARVIAFYDLAKTFEFVSWIHLAREKIEWKADAILIIIMTIMGFWKLKWNFNSKRQRHVGVCGFACMLTFRSDKLFV